MSRRADFGELYDPHFIEDESNKLKYECKAVLGQGSFGIVYRAVDPTDGAVVAIKKVKQDRRYKNRELSVIRMCSHSNVVRLKHHFFESISDSEDMYLFLVLEFIPDTVAQVIKHYSKMSQTLPLLFIQLFSYQMLRSLTYIHSRGICHRDIKPQNLLVDVSKGVLKLCDFGSSKILQPSEPSVAYICSRYYRAPELLLKATHYTTQVDVWSCGCVIAELMLGRPIFVGLAPIEQIVEIMKVIGSPSMAEVLSMNKYYNEVSFPNVRPLPWTEVFGKSVNPRAVDLVSNLLVYDPCKRSTAVQALSHPFFDDLRQEGTVLPSGRELPALFDFSLEELGGDMALYQKLVPEWYQKKHGGPSSSS